MRGFLVSPMLAMLVLAGCATTPAGPKVEIPDDCEKHAKTVPFPPVGDDPMADIAKTRGALKTANRTIVNTRDCIKSIREGFNGK